MLLNLNWNRILGCALMLCFLSGCFHPPYNNFRTDHNVARSTGGGAGLGAAVGAVASGTVTGTLIGGAAGGAVGAMVGIHNDGKTHIIKMLQKQDIQYVTYGDTMTLVIPTDKYFMFDSPRIKEICYPGMNNVVKLLKYYPKTPIYVAGFTDDVGSRRHKRLLTQSQAETILTFLWANGIEAQRLKAEGYGDQFDISDNKLIHGSAQNRRIEIQWFTGLAVQAPP